MTPEFKTLPRLAEHTGPYLLGHLEVRASLPLFAVTDPLHAHPQGLDDVQLVPDGLQHVARGYGDLVFAADGVPDSVVPAGELDQLLGGAEGDQLLAVVGPAHLLGRQAATCKVWDNDCHCDSKIQVWGNDCMI